MNTRLIITLLVVGAFAFACGPRSHSDIPVSQPAQPVRVSLNTVSAKPAEHSRRHDAAPKTPIKLDSHFHVDVAPRAVRFALNVTNIGARHAEVNFPSGQSYDFVVVDSIGREVWHWSHGRMFTQTVQNKQLGTGESMQVAETWTPQATPGRYTAIATLNSSNYPVEQRVDFVVR